MRCDDGESSLQLDLPAHLVTTKMLSLFFQLLPTDLHFCILHTWLGDLDSYDSSSLLPVLSALDIACSSTIHRAALISLLSMNAAVVPATQMRSFAYDTVVHDVLCLTRWLAKRKVGVRSLHLTPANCTQLLAFARTSSNLTFTLSTIEHIELGMGLDSFQGFQCMLSACPNLRSIGYSRGWSGELESEPTWNFISQRIARSSSEQDDIWQVLAAEGCPKLRWLDFGRNHSQTVLDCTKPCLALRNANGNILEALQLDRMFFHLPAYELMTQRCHALHTLQITVFRTIMSIDLIAQLVASCPRLRFLKLIVEEVVEADIAAVLEAAKRHLDRTRCGGLHTVYCCAYHLPQGG